MFYRYVNQGYYVLYSEYTCTCIPGKGNCLSHSTVPHVQDKIAVHYSHHSLNFKTSRHQMLQNCLFCVTNNSVVQLYSVDGVKSASLYMTSIMHSTQPTLAIWNRPCYRPTIFKCSYLHRNSLHIIM